MLPVGMGLGSRPIQPMKRIQALAYRSKHMGFSSAKTDPSPVSITEAQIKSRWEYGLLLEASIARIIAKDMDNKVDVFGQIPDGLVQAFGSPSNASDALLNFSMRQRNFMMLSLPPQPQVKLANGKVSLKLLNQGEVHPDTLAYEVKTPQGQYALTIARDITEDNVDGVYAKFRNQVIVQASKVQNVPRFYAAQPEMGWFLTEFIDANNLPKDWRSRGDKTLSQFLEQHQLVHVAPSAKNHVGPYMVDLGHIVTKDQYNRDFARVLGPAEQHTNAVKLIEKALQ